MIVLSLCLAAISVWSASARRQAAAVTQLRLLGATIYYDFNHYYERGATLNQWRQPTDWVWARKFLGNDLFSEVYHVEFIEYRDVNNHSSNGPSTFLGPVPTSTAASSDADKYVHLLSAMPNLHDLDLSYSEVSDASLPILESLRSLEMMDLDETNITEAGADRLGKSLPNCKIYWTPKRRP